MIRSIITFLVFIIVLICIACIDEVDFNVPREYQNSTVILGKIIKGNPSTVEVSIQKVFDFSYKIEQLIIVKSVKIVNEEGGKLDIPRSGTGFYKLSIDPDSEFNIEVGKSYSLEVVQHDGQSFKSEPVKLIGAPAVESFEPELVNKEVLNINNELVSQTRIEYKISTSLISGVEQSRTNLKWDFTRTYKVTDDLDNVCYASTLVDFDLIQLVNHNDIATSSLNDFSILEQTPSPLLTEGQYVFAIQEALDDGALQFWDQINQLSTNSGTFYEPPSGQLITNFYKTDDLEGSVFGYFYATEQDTLSAYVDGEFFGSTTKYCPRPETGGPSPCDVCCICIQFYTTEKPSFWMD